MPLIGLLLHKMMPIGCRFTSTARDDHTHAHARPVRERACTPRRDSHAQAHGGGHTVLLVGVCVLGVGGSLGSSLGSGRGTRCYSTRHAARAGGHSRLSCLEGLPSEARARLREITRGAGHG